MCYHVASDEEQEVIEETFQAEFEFPHEPVHHADGFTHRALPVITAEDRKIIKHLNWGLIPHWVKSWDDAKKLRVQTLNAMGETIFEKPSFRSYAPKNRCLILVNGFYEWMHVGKEKYPHFIYMKDQKPFAFGGIYSNWEDKATGKVHKTFSIVTTPANTMMEKIHNSKKRMPLIIPNEFHDAWLKADLMKDEIQNLILPLDHELMDAHTICKLITSRKESSNQPKVRERFEYPELAIQ